jgi:hypothetical protein
MQILGTWVAVDDKRKLVFEPNGVGYVEVESVRYPFFSWRAESDQVYWQLFGDEKRVRPLSKEMALNCVEVQENGQRTLEFAHPPIPFGFKRFHLSQAPNTTIDTDGVAAGHLKR